MKVCPECGSNNIIVFDSDNDLCEDCDKWFPMVAEVEEIYCHECSKAGGAGKAIYHAAPACKPTKN